MADSPKVATTKMGIVSFLVISVIGTIAEVAFAWYFEHIAFDTSVVNFNPILTILALLYIPLVIILIGVGLFGFKRNPDNKTYRGILTFAAAGFVPVIGTIMAYFVLRGRNAI